MYRGNYSGAISPRAVSSFLSKERDSHTWAKKLKNKELDRLLQEIGFKQRENVSSPLDKHQKVCISLTLAYKRFALWLDMGLGKSRVALEVILHLIKNKYISSALILAYSDDALVTWENEITKWSIDIPYTILTNSSSRKKWKRIKEFDYGIILATYAGMTRMICKKGYSRRGNEKLKLDYALIKKFCKSTNLGALVLDEATLLGHKSSLQTRANIQFSKSAPYVLELAGRPFGKDPLLLWSQLFLLDRGDSLGDTLGLFRSTFYTSKPNFWGGMEYTFRANMQKEFRRCIRHRSIQYRFEECGSLPPVVPITEYISLPQEASSYYHQLRTQLKRKFISNPLRDNIFIRMRQISSGYMGYKNDLTGDRAEIQLSSNPKLSRLLELIQTVPLDRQWVVFHEFTFSGNQISESLKKLKIKHGWLHGGIRDSKSLQHQFNAGSIRGLIIANKKGAYSLNLQNANYLFCYESPVSPIDREQMERRVRRRGQLHTVFQYDLVVRGTVDQAILQWHREGGSLFRLLVEDKR